MQSMRFGSKGDGVRSWQQFLRGVGLYMGEADGEFGRQTLAATQAFQLRHGLRDDGIAGNRTLGLAMQLGLDAFPDDPTLADSLEWPPPPGFASMDAARRRSTFGSYDFVPAPTLENPEGIRILGNWVNENIETFSVPQLAGKPGANANGRAQFHRLVGPKVQLLFSRWESENLLHHVLTYAGSFAPRFVRGSRSTLSPHAHGSAFDINVAWNGLGAVPARRGAKGSVRELVPIANELGFYWGGHFTRRDGMHFELAEL